MDPGCSTASAPGTGLALALLSTRPSPKPRHALARTSSLIENEQVVGPGKDLVLHAAGLGEVVIPAAELVERFSRASGPGGQGVNTTDSRVELLFDPGASAAFTAAQRDRLLERLSDRLVAGSLRLVGSQYRSQNRNRAAVRERLRDLLVDALAPPAPGRRPTRPTRGSQTRRLEAKKRRGDLKSTRGRVPPAPE